ncbi:DUF4954 family protein [Sphingobacterium wenxiniae]|uniref:DUF4954 domain-containing protein n=1 Tax=Sphingobacterium wenxiniae TaxID=683125 RepID=A0A1I6VZN9_9SPHI|nr:DUF4954 family protein [Sphingobacterium wenxiniae]SFT18864.1 protein of unknown function [Sphingobacterium wenxiniae]
MANIVKEKLQQLGYGFVPTDYLVDNDEYLQRNQQFQSDRRFRQLTSEEIAILTENNNVSSNWDDVWVTDRFIPQQIQYSKFYGFVRIGDMDDVYLEYRDLRLSCGIYHSCIVSCDLGNTVAIHHVRYMAHFIIGDDVMLTNINEMETNSAAKFGNGMRKRGEVEERRIRLELCNENGGRAVLPFDGMQAADAYLWSRHRHDTLLQKRFEEITENQFSDAHGFYSYIGDRCVIKNSHTIKDVKIGTDAYIKGVNKLKNLTINSCEDAYTQIGEGCELVNGIIGYGCRVFYGVKAVRFVLSSFSQLKYGARLINSFLGDNSTISCCEVLNSLLFPAHEQHHNNSFLCASLVKGQSNMAAGATVGSNHNSRAADGEIVAGRGFWPGLCVSLKHNSRFASYTLIVKGDFLHALDIRLPFSLVSNEVSTNNLLVMPAYWFMHNMYALMRNETKFEARDKRKFKNQYIEYAILAPDTVNEIFEALTEIEVAVGRAFGAHLSMEEQRQIGRRMLESAESFGGREITLQGVEASKRKVILVKPRESYQVYKRIIRYYAASQLLQHFEQDGYEQVLTNCKEATHRKAYENIGGQLVPKEELEVVLQQIRQGEITSWDEVHQQYQVWSDNYLNDKLIHAIASLVELIGMSVEEWTPTFLRDLFEEAKSTREWICAEIHRSRAKDYDDPFKLMVYESMEEMEEVVGKLAENDFINKEQEATTTFVNRIERLGL